MGSAAGFARPFQVSTLITSKRAPRPLRWPAWTYFFPRHGDPAASELHLPPRRLILNLLLQKGCPGEDGVVTVSSAEPMLLPVREVGARHAAPDAGRAVARAKRVPQCAVASPLQRAPGGPGERRAVVLIVSGLSSDPPQQVSPSILGTGGFCPSFRPSSAAPRPPIIRCRRRSCVILLKL